MQVDVGAGVMMQAEAASISSVLVDVGLGFRVECDIADAQDITSLQMSAAQVRCFPGHTHRHIRELKPAGASAALQYGKHSRHWLTSQFISGSSALCRQTWQGMPSTGVPYTLRCSGSAEAAGR